MCKLGNLHKSSTSQYVVMPRCTITDLCKWTWCGKFSNSPRYIWPSSQQLCDVKLIKYWTLSTLCYVSIKVHFNKEMIDHVHDSLPRSKTPLAERSLWLQMSVFVSCWWHIPKISQLNKNLQKTCIFCFMLNSDRISIIIVDK